jgi:NADH-quinone oxidoreductase subunit N
MMRALVPEVVVLTFALVILMLDLLVRRKEILGYVTLAGALLAVYFVVRPLCADGQYFSAMITVDRFVAFFDVLFLAALVVTVFISMHYLDTQRWVHGEYYALLLLATLGMMLLAKAADLVMVFLGIETLSLAVYILAGYLRQEKKSNEAALKYVLLGAFSTAFLLYGIALIYGSTGSTNLLAIAQVIAQENILADPLLLLAMALIMVGFAFKVSLVPFHMWTPDVYEGAPTPITAFMAVGVKAAALAAFLHVFLLAFPDLHPHWGKLLWGVAVLTMTVGNLIAISQTNIKRMLAYSSIAHAGYILIGMIAGGETGVSSVLYYLVVYMFMNMGAFAVVTAYGSQGDENLEIKDYAGMGWRQPWLAFAMLVFLFSLAGIPPMAGFMGKLYIFSAAIKSGYVWLTIIGVINSVISAFYYLRVIETMYLKPAERTVIPMTARPALIVALIVTVFFTLQIGLFPALTMEFARLAAVIGG